MGRIFFIARSYSPNAASDIRYRSLMKGLVSKQKITFVYLLPDLNNSILEPLSSNINVINLWKRHVAYNRISRFFYLYFNLITFISRLNKGDIVVDLACCEILPFLLKKRGIKVFYELSEHPEVSLSASRISPSINRFLKLCRRLTGLFVISSALKDYFVEKGVKESRIHVINMVVDESRFLGLLKESSSKYIVYCGMASNNKDGVDQLIKSFAVVTKAYPDYKLMIIGKTPNPDQSFDNMMLVDSLGLSEKVIFTGAIPYYQVPQLIVNAEILALDRPDNKQAKYGFPTKLGEYLISGNPVVITRVGDIPLFLKHRDSAVIAKPDDVASFSSELLWVIEHPKQAKQIGERGRAVAFKCFNGVTEGKKLLGIINSYQNEIL